MKLCPHNTAKVAKHNHTRSVSMKFRTEQPDPGREDGL